MRTSEERVGVAQTVIIIVVIDDRELIRINSVVVRFLEMNGLVLESLEA